jgi:hypothetical protein
MNMYFIFNSNKIILRIQFHININQFLELNLIIYHIKIKIILEFFIYNNNLNRKIFYKPRAESGSIITI